MKGPPDTKTPIKVCMWAAEVRPRFFFSFFFADDRAALAVWLLGTAPTRSYGGTSARRTKVLTLMYCLVTLTRPRAVVCQVPLLPMDLHSSSVRVHSLECPHPLPPLGKFTAQKEMEKRQRQTER